MYSCQTELFEIELFIYIKVDLALEKQQQRLICHKTQINKQTNLPGTLYPILFKHNPLPFYFLFCLTIHRMRTGPLKKKKKVTKFS